MVFYALYICTAIAITTASAWILSLLIVAFLTNPLLRVHFARFLKHALKRSSQHWLIIIKFYFVTLPTKYILFYLFIVRYLRFFLLIKKLKPFRFSRDR